MRTIKGTTSILAALTMAALVASCGKKSSSDESSATTNSDGSTKLTALTSPDQLGISTALGAVKLPSAYSGGKATSLALTSDKKSQDACLMGDGVKSATDGLKNVANFFCHIEVEKAQIKFGTKYSLTSSGKDFAKVWIDNADAANGNINVYMCQNGSLQQAIKVSGVKMGSDGKPSGVKGTVANSGGDSTSTWKSSTTFDKGYTGAYLEAASKDKFTQTESNGSFTRAVVLKLFDDATEVSHISMSSSGSWGGNAFKQRGYAKGANDLGEALFADHGIDNSNNSFDWTHRSYFTQSTGIVAAVGDSANFASGGSLYVATTDLPDFLAADFSPDAPSGWDCSGADTVVDLNPDSAAHKACESDHADNSCWGTDYEQGDVVQ